MQHITKSLTRQYAPISHHIHPQNYSSNHLFCTFLYDGGFIVLLISFPAYGGIREIDPMAKTRQTNPLLRKKNELAFSPQV